MRTSSNDGVVLEREPAKELAEGTGALARVADWTGALPRVVQRRNLGGIVIAAVSGCTLILVAAAITRVSQASASAHAAAATAEPPAATTSSSNRDPAQAVKAEPAPEPAPTTGTLRLERPAWLSRTTVDGKKLTSASETLSCGKHIVKVTGWRAHPIDVPCGGEFVLQH
ncbi:MAG TPA: hypothetical protein VGL81_03270 [Polyangiaceae bacterium]|jgi:hypothetical protein